MSAKRHYETSASQVVRVRRALQRRVALGMVVLGAAPFIVSSREFGGADWIAGFVVGLWGLARYLRIRTESLGVDEVSGGAPADVEISGGRLSLKSKEGTEHLSLDAISQGWMIPGLARQTVILETKHEVTYAITVERESEADALLDAAGVSADRKLVRMRIAPASNGFAGGCFSVIVAIIATIAGALGITMLLMEHAGIATYVTLAIVALAFAGLLQLSYPPLLSVGVDGFWIRSLFRKRFVAWSGVASIGPRGARTSVDMVDGTAVTLAPLGRGARGDVTRARLALHDILRRALEASRRHRADAKIGELLDRGEGDFATWISRLGRVTRSDDYRTRRITADDLAMVARDPEAAPQRRIAAAVALRVEDPNREELRAAADSTADDDLRAALEAAANDELTEEVAERAIRRAVKRAPAR